MNYFIGLRVGSVGDGSFGRSQEEGLLMGEGIAQDELSCLFGWILN